MGSKVAPWLQGLEETETWDVPANTAASSTNHISSATHDAHSLHRSQGREPRRTRSGLPSSIGSQKNSSNGTTHIRRSPLAPLSSSNANTLRRRQKQQSHGDSTKLPRSASLSCSSGDHSSEYCGTVQQRSKSASPAKNAETLEWKRRLVHGRVGYGDQTELFAPSGLENIFARSKGPENEAPKHNSRMSWLPKSDAPMPSSPPSWPSSLMGSQQRGTTRQSSLPHVEEETSEQDFDYSADVDGSFRSNPFDLRNTPEIEEKSRSAAHEGHSAGPAEHYHEPVGNRTISGQTELQEDFSPVYISKHTSQDGRVNYAPLDSHAVQHFETMRVHLRHPSQEGSSQDEELLPIEPSTFTDGPESDPAPAHQDFSLSENLQTGTPPVGTIGQHIEIRRGGYSTQGSFRQRPLSPSPSKSEEEEAAEEDRNEDVEHSLSSAPTPPQHGQPATPLRPVTPNPPKTRSSGSPLKLFAAHDTFTSKRLLRRMSQLDPESFDGEGSKPASQRVPKTSADESQADDSRVSSKNSFGSGELNSYPFRAEITITGASDDEESASDRTPGSDVPVPGSKAPLRFRLDSSPEVRGSCQLKRKLSKQSAARSSKNSTLSTLSKVNAHLQPTVEDATDLDASHVQVEQVKSYDGGKRPPTSPFKNPTPKRRRTLHASELEDAVAEANVSYHEQLQQAINDRKRRDSRQGEKQNIAGPEVLATRKRLRPRNPTPGQQRQQEIENGLREAAEEFAAQEPEKLEAVMEHIENSIAGSDEVSTLQMQAEAMAAEVASFTFKVQKPSGEHGKRKPSVTTQDFLNEAMMVMQLIRAKARPRSNLSSVEESEAEGNSAHTDGSLLDTDDPLRISRPPSREGGHSGWRSAAQSQTDARVVSHLRKFQEVDDTEFIAESIASLGMDDDDSMNDNVVVVDEHSNIRITCPPADHGRDELSDESRPVTQDSQASTLHTHGTVETCSTRRSQNVGTLAPDDVGHLIAEEIGGMVFDKVQQRWVRVKSPAKDKSGLLEPPSNITSDDDPFREISDLAVDEQVELRRISSSGRSVKQTVQPPREEITEDVQPPTAAQSRAASNETVLPRPATRDSSHMQSRIHHMHSSSVPSVPSRYTAFGSSQQMEKVETRATSWSDEQLAKMSAVSRAKQQPLAYAAVQATLALRGERDALIEQPIEEATEATILSSPKCASEADESVESIQINPHIGFRDDTVLNDEESSIERICSPRVRDNTVQPRVMPPSSALRGRTPQMSLRRQTLMNKLTNEKHEHSELSLIAALPGERMMSVSLSVSRPVTKRGETHVAKLLSSPSKADPNGTFLLSDLPDFTVHEADDERPSERALAARLAHHAAAEVDDRYALAVRDLVKTLTNVQEDEPYWEDLKELNLNHQALESIYGLDDFCNRVQSMDVSNNALTQLHGAPFTLRRLVARSNRLSSVTHWGHMVNLQYLDISCNKLDSLRGLSHLIHLREIVADDNQIINLEGVLELDGLLKLRLRRNKLQMLDFDGSQMHRLIELDACENKIAAIKHLDRLPALETLRMDRNLFKGGIALHQGLSKLEMLSLRNCGLSHLYVGTLQRLRTLDVDDNSLADLTGIEKLNGLSCLSMRRQKLSKDARIALFDHPLDVSTLRLSGNAIPAIDLQRTFLSLQHLELASTGLQSLSQDFGLNMPNLRTLNLNFNSLKDIRPLLNIQKLEHLSIAGNRIDRLRKTVATLGKLTTLKCLDLRDNHVTQCFYAPSVTAQTSVVRHTTSEDPGDEDEHTRLIEQARHALPSGDPSGDLQHAAKLDEETKLRRRVYEMLLAHSCMNLERVDGLAFDKSKANLRDRVWDRLVELGIVRKSQSS
ncbi:Leucine-rich repeat protein [Teratosphaeria destructans]|uniref:Leucine-rich repeat protein n=1 Tax=Teratosphaeria destructans TaxID=418781 RepID=A0A9W7T0T5_9PEZI|nr:Leucine-rich repeat protein [Teratosphaeria destructans]